jgi:ubiquinone/menaquinone biosynthesis C-methylase UbiE
MSLIVNANVEKYDDIYKNGHDKSYPNLDLVRLERWYFNGKPGAALDYGCGTGVNMIHLLSRGYRATGIEASAEGLKLVERKLQSLPADQRERADLKLIDPNSKRLPLDDNSLDYVVCMSVLSLLETKERIQELIAEFHRVLKPGGKMIVDVNGPTSDFAAKGKFISEDIYEFSLRDHHKGGVLCYCPQSKESFAKLFGQGWVMDDLGYVAFNYANINELEFLACVHKA